MACVEWIEAVEVQVRLDTCSANRTRLEVYRDEHHFTSTIDSWRETVEQVNSSRLIFVECQTDHEKAYVEETAEIARIGTL